MTVSRAQPDLSAVRQGAASATQTVMWNWNLVGVCPVEFTSTSARQTQEHIVCVCGSDPFSDMWVLDGFGRRAYFAWLPDNPGPMAEHC